MTDQTFEEFVRASLARIERRLTAIEARRAEAGGPPPASPAAETRSMEATPPPAQRAISNTQVDDNKATLVSRLPNADEAPRSYRTMKAGVSLDSLCTFLGLNPNDFGRTWSLSADDGTRSSWTISRGSSRSREGVSPFTLTRRSKTHCSRLAICVRHRASKGPRLTILTQASDNRSE